MYNDEMNFDYLWVETGRLLEHNTFLRQVGACYLFCYTEEHVTCKKYIIG